MNPRARANQTEPRTQKLSLALLHPLACAQEPELLKRIVTAVSRRGGSRAIYSLIDGSYFL